MCEIRHFDSESTIQSEGCEGERRTCLLHVESTVCPLRHFSEDHRAKLDIEHLLERCTVRLNEEETDLRAILERLLNQHLTQKELSLKPTILGHVLRFVHANSYDVPFIKRRIQSVETDDIDSILDQNWVLLPLDVDGIAHRRVLIARLISPVNLGPDLAEVRFVLLVLSPADEKPAKSALETGRTFGTIFARAEHRVQLEQADTEREFKELIRRQAKQLEQVKEVERHESEENKAEEVGTCWFPGRGVVNDLRLRLKWYKSDYVDGFRTGRDVQKTISAAVFLYFSILPTVIALGLLNDQNTDVKKEILSQCVSGLIFGLVGGQPYLVMLSTAPISICIQIIQQVCDDAGYDFFKVYAMTGIWCSVFLALAALLELAKVMRSLEELFGLFISVALIIRSVGAMGDAVGMHGSNCPLNTNETRLDVIPCSRSSGLLFVILALGTAWLSIKLYSFRSSSFLSKAKRELVSDYALPIGVIIMSTLYIAGLKDVRMQSFAFHADEHVTLSSMLEQSAEAHGFCVLLGVPVAVLFFMDQLIVTNTVDNRQNRLRKSGAPNWDLLVVACINAGMSVLGLPWTHGALPQAFLHLKALADVEDHVVEGTVQTMIVKNRETRCATLLAHLLMVPTYLFLLPYLQMVPTAVFHGLFLYLAITSMEGNELVERIGLMFMEQRSYPPCHYLRRVPQRVVHLFTAIEVQQLVLLVLVGHLPWPVLELAFPVVTFLFIPFRAFCLPRVIHRDYLEVLDGVH